MKKIFLLLFCFLFPFTVFAEQNLPSYVIKKEESNNYFYFGNYVIDTEKYQKYINDYKASQITETEISLSTGNITISTEGSFLHHDDAYARPNCIKIKENIAGALKQGSIYLTIDEGTLLKEMKCTTTSGNITASAMGNGKTIKIDIEQQSTIPSEITITNLTILTNRMNENEWKERECILSLCCSNTLENNIFSEHTDNIIINARFWTQHNPHRISCSDFYFEGRLAFPVNQNYYILNDTKFYMKGNSYIKDNTLMVPVYSLGEALFLENEYHSQFYYPTREHYDNSHFLNWYPENEVVTIYYKNNVLFQNQSNMAQIFYHHNTDFLPTTIDNAIQMPVATEIKNNVLYVPVRSAIIALTSNDIYYNWDEKTKTFYLGQ